MILRFAVLSGEVKVNIIVGNVECGEVNGKVDLFGLRSGYL